MEKNRFKTTTDEIWRFYISFIESGFTKEQAFELVSTYMHRSILEDMINGKKYMKRNRSDIIKEMYEQNKNRQEKLKENEDEK